MDNTTSDESPFDDDETSPIPFVHRYDNVVTFEGGGAYLGMVISAPLDSGHRSLSRLKEKLRSYLESFFSQYGHQNWQTPREGKMRIYIKIPQSSSLEAFGAIQEFKDDALSRGVEVVMSTTN